MQRELEVLRDEMGVIYRSVEDLKSRVEARAGAVSELEARTTQRQRQLFDDLSGDLA